MKKKLCMGSHKFKIEKSHFLLPASYTHTVTAHFTFFPTVVQLLLIAGSVPPAVHLGPQVIFHRAAFHPVDA